MKNTRIMICLWLLIFPTYGFSLKHDSSPNTEIQSIKYKTMASMRTREKRSVLILWIVIEPTDFVRDRMLLLAHQLNQDFPNEQRIYAVIFDSEDWARHYNPAGGSYYISKKLERGEYNLDRLKGRESINYSSQRGNSVDEIKITVSGKFSSGRHRTRKS